MESVKTFKIKKQKKDAKAPSAPKGLKVSRVQQIRDYFSKSKSTRTSMGGQINTARKKREKALKDATNY